MKMYSISNGFVKANSSVECYTVYKCECGFTTYSEDVSGEKKRCPKCGKNMKSRVRSSFNKKVA